MSNESRTSKVHLVSAAKATEGLALGSVELIFGHSVGPDLFLSLDPSTAFTETCKAEAQTLWVHFPSVLMLFVALWWRLCLGPAAAGWCKGFFHQGFACGLGAVQALGMFHEAEEGR